MKNRSPFSVIRTPVSSASGREYRAPKHAPGEPAGLTARRAALEILLRVERESSFADALLGRRLGQFAPADRRLITQLVLGTIAWRGRLDFELARLSTRPLESLASEVLAALRMGLFQLRMMSRVPPHAAVDTAVALAGEHRRSAAGFVNAILRAALRHGAVTPPVGTEQIQALAITCSHPRWLAEALVQWFGKAQAKTLMEANNQAAPTAIRLNLARGSSEALTDRLASEGVKIIGRGRFPETLIASGSALFDSAAYRDGVFYVQSEASQMAVRMLGPAPGATVIDCAAAPGGKTTHLAELVGSRGQVIALDRSFTGLRRTRAAAVRLGHRNVQCIEADIESTPPLKQRGFDYVLLDAPCTGLGTLREHPEIRWRLRPGDFSRMAKVQLRMLENAASLVKSSGAIVYCVCSVAPQEGPEVIREFLNQHSEFEVGRDLPNRERLADVLDGAAMMRTRPDRGGLDGFFAARLKRIGS